MVWNKLGVLDEKWLNCLWRNVCGIFWIVSERHINSLPLCLICAISFCYQSGLHFPFHSDLSAASAYYYFPCLCSSLSPAPFILYSWSPCLQFLCFPSQYFCFICRCSHAFSHIFPHNVNFVILAICLSLFKSHFHLSQCSQWNVQFLLKYAHSNASFTLHWLLGPFSVPFWHFRPTQMMTGEHMLQTG